MAQEDASRALRRVRLRGSRGPPPPASLHRSRRPPRRLRALRPHGSKAIPPTSSSPTRLLPLPPTRTSRSEPSLASRPRRAAGHLTPSTSRAARRSAVSRTCPSGSLRHLSLICFSPTPAARVAARRPSARGRPRVGRAVDGRALHCGPHRPGSLWLLHEFSSSGRPGGRFCRLVTTAAGRSGVAFRLARARARAAGVDGHIWVATRALAPHPLGRLALLAAARATSFIDPSSSPWRRLSFSVPRSARCHPNLSRRLTIRCLLTAPRIASRRCRSRHVLSRRATRCATSSIAPCARTHSTRPAKSASHRGETLSSRPRWASCPPACSTWPQRRPTRPC